MNRPPTDLREKLEWGTRLSLQYPYPTAHWDTRRPMPAVGLFPTWSVASAAAWRRTCPSPAALPSFRCDIRPPDNQPEACNPCCRWNTSPPPAQAAEAARGIWQY